MKKLVAFLTPLFFTTVAAASLLNITGPAEVFEKANVAKSATARIDGETLHLTSIGKGLRSKKVVFLNVKVYVANLFVNTPENLNLTDSDILTSLKNQKAVAMQLHFLRDVEAEKVQKSFKEALKANNINTEEKSMKEFLTAATSGGEAKEGRTITILGAHAKDGSEIVYYENTSGQISEVKGPSGFIEKVFSIWFGTPADEGIAALKKGILKK